MLSLACRICNQAKGNTQPEAWLEELGKKSRKKIDKRRHKGLSKVVLEGKRPSLAHTAAVNVTSNALHHSLLFTGGRTKYNRHCLDAACIGNIIRLEGWNQPLLLFMARIVSLKIHAAEKSVNGLQPRDMM